ncbi:unnamed protein product [Pseudo-nitzschia multistriata]|uniref:RxLR effector protein n=1 Tax=Pseudo-nitzschia multistriata TaxID=183589 RepID=A0A448ZIU6_9STRA|nr:unnamed protein product [Pseudo-nitzschia multistriata]
MVITMPCRSLTGVLSLSLLLLLCSPPAASFLAPHRSHHPTTHRGSLPPLCSSFPPGPGHPGGFPPQQPPPGGEAEATDDAAAGSEAEGQANTRFSKFAPDPSLDTDEFRLQLRENMKADLERRRSEDPNRGNQVAKNYLDSL